MNENYQKSIQELHELITNQIKAPLFGNSGLFGGLNGNHEVLELFANYVDNLKKEYKHIPVHLSSKTFVDHLKDQAVKKNTNFDAIITTIQNLHQDKVIVDEPPERNTFYNFALILDNLGVIDDEKLISVNYNKALTEAINFKPVNITKNNVETAKNKNEPQTTKKEKSIKQPEITGENLSESASATTETPEATEQTQEISADIDSKKEQQKIQEADQILSTNKVDEPEQKPEPFDLRDTTFHPIVKPSQKKPDEEENPIETSKLESAEFTGSGRQVEFETGQQTPAINNLGTTATGSKPAKRMRPIGGNLRKPVTKTERLREITLQPGEKDKKKSEKAAEQENAAEMEQTNAPRAITQGGVTQSIGGSSHLGKKLAKLAGAGIAGGTILPLFGGGSADAEAASLSGNFAHTFDKILNFITHLFS